MRVITCNNHLHNIKHTDEKEQRKLRGDLSQQTDGVRAKAQNNGWMCRLKQPRCNVQQRRILGKLASVCKVSGNTHIARREGCSFNGRLPYRPVDRHPDVRLASLCQFQSMWVSVVLPIFNDTSGLPTLALRTAVRSPPTPFAYLHSVRRRTHAQAPFPKAAAFEG